MRRFLTAIAVFSLLACRAEAVCTISYGNINLEVPTLGDTGAVWAACTRRNFISISTNTLAAGSTTQNAIFAALYTARLGGAPTSGGIRISSSAWLDSGTYLMIGGTATVAGNAFSVGVSTLFVSGGLVGIGTTAPSEALDVRGDIISNSSITASAFFGSGANLTGIPSSSSISALYVLKAGDRMTGPLATSSTMTVEGNAFSVATSTFVVANGVVGVGTTSPGATLGVSENSTTGSLMTDASIRVANPATATNSFATVQVEGNNGATVGTFVADGLGTGGVISGTGAGVYLNATDRLILAVDSLESMRLATAGNVGIGSSSPNAKLDVNGTANFGSTGSQSTFSLTGDLYMNPGSTLTLSGANGNIVSAASVTASAFFGSGAALTGIPSTAAIVAADGLIGASTATLRSDLTSVGAATASLRVDLTSVGAATATLRSDLTSVGVSTAALFGTKLSTGGGTVDGALTMSGASANIVSGASVTASAFFGYGGNLTGIVESNTYSSTKTFTSLVQVGSVTTTASGAAVYAFTASSGIQVQNGGGIRTSTGGIIFADGTVQVTASTGSSSAIYASTKTAGIASVSWTNTTVGACIAGSTVTMTTTGCSGKVVVAFNGTFWNNTVGFNVRYSVLRNGVNVSGNATYPYAIQKQAAASVEIDNASFQILDTGVSCGSNSWCLAPSVDGNQGAIGTNFGGMTAYEIP